MSDVTRRYTVLGFGEKYRAPADPKKGRPPGPPPVGRALADARALLGGRIDRVLAGVSAMAPERHLSEVVVELRLDDKFLAKSYNPKNLIENAGLSIRGTGTWTQLSPPRPSKKAKTPPKDALEPRKSRSLYVSGTATSLRKLQTAIRRHVSDEVDRDLCKIEDIRLPDRSDRLREELIETGEDRAIEIVFFDWNSRLREEAVARVVKLLRSFDISEEAWRVRTYDGGPTFLAAVVPDAVLSELAEYNFLRVARALPRVHLTKSVERRVMASVPTRVQPIVPASRIAVFDGGYAQGHALLDPFVTAFDLTTSPPDPDDVEHGTWVASAAVFGPFPVSGAVPPPRTRVLSYRVLPDSQNDLLELYGAIDAIELQVPALPANVKVVNLSFGPRGPIDDVPSRFTYSIDSLARNHDVLFVTAIGNDGALAGFERVQAPADSVNNIAVGAYRFDSDDEPEHALYSSVGPGRSGGVVKPDVVAFGGCSARRFFVLMPTAGDLGGVMGTSFAAPLVSALAGELSALVQPQVLGAEALRALLVHTAAPTYGTLQERGHGMVADSAEMVLACSAQRVTVLYQGTVSPREHWKLPFLLPPNFSPGGGLQFSWTIAFTPQTDQPRPDEYTLAGLEPQFRPHSDVFSMNPPKGSSGKALTLNIVTDSKRYAGLLKQGWKPSPLPASDTSKGKTERELRASDGKWDTLVRGERNKRPKSVSEPILTLGVLGRGSWDQKSPALTARYAALLTVDAPKYQGDLYADVVRNYTKLKQLTLQQRERSRG